MQETQLIELGFFLSWVQCGSIVQELNEHLQACNRVGAAPFAYIHEASTVLAIGRIMSNDTHMSAIKSLDDAIVALQEAKALKNKPGGLTARVVAEVSSGIFILNHGDLIRELLLAHAGVEAATEKKVA